MMTLLVLSAGLMTYSRKFDRIQLLSFVAPGLPLIMYHVNEAEYCFYATLATGAYIMTLWPLLLRQVANFPPGQVLGVAVATYLVNILLSIWIVAFGIIPGSSLVRGRADILLFAALLCCGCGTGILATVEQVISPPPHLMFQSTSKGTSSSLPLDIQRTTVHSCEARRKFPQDNQSR